MHTKPRAARGPPPSKQVVFLKHNVLDEDDEELTELAKAYGVKNGARGGGSLF
jgi:hypothetical protein